MKSFIACILLLIILSPAVVCAQSGNTYMDAVHLMREAKYEQAYTIFSKLLKDDPTNYPVFDQTVTVLVNLKRYEEAISLTSKRLNKNYSDIILTTRLAELFHLNSEYDKAYEMWDLALKANQQSVNAYRFVADNMTQRREHEKAIEVYSSARQRFNNNSLFFSEITTNYMALGDRSKAVSTLLDVLDFSPGNSAFVLRQIINFDDYEFSELAIVELDERSRSTLSSLEIVAAQKEVLIGLLIELKFFRRALSTARSYESTLSNGNWPVFTLAGRFKSIQEFKLADEALDFYINLPSHPLLPRALEDKATLYMTWAKYLNDYNLINEIPSDTLVARALDSLNKLLRDFPADNRRIETLSLKTELVLDHFSDTTTANELVKEIRRLAFNSEHQIIADYLEGRINIVEGYHSLARVNLTRSNREARTGELAEKTRYFLALNDFYAGDFEFSSIQMRALERLTTSYYANDALMLRVWMSEGMVKDSVSNELKRFARASYFFDTNQVDQAILELLPFFESTDSAPLTADAVLAISNTIRHSNPFLAYHVLDTSLPRSSPAKRERLLWEKTRIMELMMQQSDTSTALPPDHVPLAKTVFSLSNTTDKQIENASLINWLGSASITSTDLRQAYENILLEFPTGFYAQTVRQRLESLKNSPS